MVSREGIHEGNIDKRLESFALCYSQSLLLADFTLSYGFLRLEFSTATRSFGLADAYAHKDLVRICLTVYAWRSLTTLAKDKSKSHSYSYKLLTVAHA